MLPCYATAALLLLLWLGAVYPKLRGGGGCAGLARDDNSVHKSEMRYPRVCRLLTVKISVCVDVWRYVHTYNRTSGEVHPGKSNWPHAI